MNQLHPTQFYQDQWNALRFEALTWALSIMGLGAVGLAAVSETRPAKLMSLSIATGLVAGGRQAKVGAQRTSSRARDVENVSNVAQTQVMFDSMTDLEGKARAAGVLWKPDNLFDLRQLATRPDHYPHVMVIGGTGDGKSTLVEWIIDQEREARRLYISPTRDDVEFLNYEVFGNGIVEGRQYALDYEQITQAIQFLVNECYQRYHLNADQSRQRGYINAVLDEYRLTAKIGKDLDGTDAVQIINPISAQPMSYSEAVSYLVTVARKRFIRMWLLLQSETVKATGLEGEGDVRESLVKLRLGSFARNHLARLVSQGRWPQEALQWFDSQPPRQVCMLDEQLALVPHLHGYQQNKAQSFGYEPPVPQNIFAEMTLRGNTPVVHVPTEPTPMALPPDFTSDDDEEDEGVTDELSPRSCVTSESSSPEISSKVSPETFLKLESFVQQNGLRSKTRALASLGYKGDTYKEGCLVWSEFMKWRTSTL